MNEIEHLASWGVPLEVTTKFGPRLLRKARPDETFWRAWRADKDALKRAGVSVTKDEWGQWEACWWLPIPEEIAKARAESVEASRALETTEDIPAPEGLSYYPFQRAGIAYARSRARVLIADEPGLGKTIQALGVLNCTPDARRVLVICPASVKLNWRREAERWLIGTWTIHVLNGGAPPDAERLMVIVNYDQLGKHEAFIQSQMWDAVIVDEAHYIRNAKTQRSQRVRAIDARRRIYLTGTPIVNSPADLWPLVGGCDERLRDYSRFKARYIFAPEDKRAQRLEELQRILRESCMVRRRKADVLTELPPKTRQIIAIEPHTPAQIAAVQREIERAEQHEAELVALRVRAELAKAESEEAYRAAVAQLTRAATIAFEEIAAARHETALAKVPDVIEHLDELLSQVSKVVVWAHHYDVIDAIYDAARERGWNPVRLTGQTSAEDRQRAVDAFQRDEACRVFVGNLRAGGIGITLTAASHVVVAELPWTAEAMTQAEDRCHRIGQRDNVLVQHIVLNGSIDVRMAQAIIEKQYISDKALDDPIKADPVLPTRSEPAATESATIAQIVEEAMAITPEQIAAIHDALRMLAAMDADYAATRNDVGFNKFDSAIGHELAKAERLTPRQAALGRRLLRKYRRQIGDDALARCGL